MTFPPAEPWPSAQNWGPPQPMPGQPWGPPPGVGYPPPPPPGKPPRSRTGLVIAVIALVLVALVVVVGLVLWLTGSSANARIVKESALTGVLLTKSEAGTIMGTGPLAGNPDYGNGAIEKSWDSQKVDDPCNVGTPAAQEEHDGSGSSTVRRQSLESPHDTDPGPEFLVDQAVVAYPDADAARRYVATRKDKWQQCAGKTYSQSDAADPSAAPFEWRNGDVSDSDDMVLSSTDQIDKDADGWTCHYAVAPRDNVVVEVQLCGFKADGEPVKKFVSKITEKVDKAAKSE